MLPKIWPDPIRELSQWRNHAVDVVIAYKWKLKDWQMRFASKSMEDEEWHPLFVEALRNKDRIEYLLDELMDGNCRVIVPFFIGAGMILLYWF